MKHAYVILAALCLALTGCATHGVMLEDAKVAKIKRGETTEAQLIATLGQPTTVTVSNGKKMIVYSGANAQARPASFIPIVGIFAGGSDVQASSVVFSLDDQGVVSDIVTSRTNTGTGIGAAGGASGTSGTNSTHTTITNTQTNEAK